MFYTIYYVIVFLSILRHFLGHVFRSLFSVNKILVYLWHLEFQSAS